MNEKELLKQIDRIEENVENMHKRNMRLIRENERKDDYIKKVEEINMNLQQENEDLKQLMQGLTPEMIRRYKEAVKTKHNYCILCEYQEISSECDFCTIVDDKFEFFNDAEVKENG